jgi:polynucleotide 5'-hydroxyl-kinase GRC3/NOL9
MDVHSSGALDMNLKIEKDKTLLIDGPASVTIASGKVQVFGTMLTSPKRVVIREGKRLPFAVEETAIFEISTGEKAKIEEMSGSTNPPSWEAAFEELSNTGSKPVTAMVLGATDCGKTSFCTFVTNELVNKKNKVAIIDGDLGQSDIGPPSTVAYNIVTKPLTDLFTLKAKNAVFVGATSPGLISEKVIDGLVLLKDEALTYDPDYVIIDTDGWTNGECAVEYKVKLAEKLCPEIIFYIQQRDELVPLLDALKGMKLIQIEFPSALKARDKENRRSLRELGYQKYLRNTKVQSLPLNWVKINDNSLFGLGRGREDLRRARKVYELLGTKPLHYAEMNDRIIIVIGRKRWIASENLKKIEEFTKKEIEIIRTGEEEGLITALYGPKGRFLGIGVLQEIDYVRKALKVLTSVTEEISSAAIGKVRLDKNMKEIPSLEEEPIDFSSLEKLAG